MAYELTDRMKKNLMRLSDDDNLCPHERAAIQMARARMQELETRLAAITAERDRMRDLWQQYLSAEDIIRISGYMDNPTDAQRARDRMVKVREQARAALASPADSTVKGRSLGLDKTELDAEETEAFLDFVAESNNDAGKGGGRNG